MKKIHFLAGAIAMVMAPGTASATLPDIAAARCDDCNNQQFDAKAISLGTGKKYLYDFIGRSLRYYQVAREPKPGGGFLYDVVELGADPVYLAYFDDSLSYRDLYGAFSKVIVLNLPGAPNAGGHSNDSVYSLFLTGEGATNFGIWLGSYFTSQGIPVEYPDAAERLDNLIRLSPAIRYTDPQDAKRLVVVVDFEDGKATFDLTEDTLEYKLRPGTARDSDGRPIPANLAGVSPVPYVFPGGRESSNFRNFGTLIHNYIGNSASAWQCGTASGGGSSSVSCVLVR